MKVLLLCPAMHRVCTWFRCYHLGAALARGGHAVTLLKVSPERRVIPRVTEEAGMRLYETPRFWGGRVSHNGTRLPSDLLARVALVWREPFDVVHTFSHHVNAMLPGFASKLRRAHGVLVADWDDLWTDGGIYG